MSDWEYSDSNCPKCGETLAWRRCDALGCDEDLEDDGFPPGVCDSCNGAGYQEWCRECGFDVVFNCFLSPQYEQEWLEKQKAVSEANKVLENEFIRSL